MAERMDDIRAVIDGVGSNRAAILGVSEGGTLGMTFAHAHPDRAQTLILYGSWARRMAGPDYPWGPNESELEALLGRMLEGWATGTWWDGGQPSRADTPRHRAWWANYLRMAASPAMAQSLIRMNARLDIRSLLPEIRTPTLILTAPMTPGSRSATRDTWPLTSLRPGQPMRTEDVLDLARGVAAG